MSEKWVLVPVEPSEQMLDASWHQAGESRQMRERYHHRIKRHYDVMLSAAPPIPDDVWSEMVERGKRALMARDAMCSQGRCSYPPGCMCEAEASACLRAALGIDRAAADAVHEPESKP